jgi:hypothetical protein
MTNKVETNTPIMEVFKVKIKSDGSLDKFKTRLFVRGNLQNGDFLANAARLKIKVKQLDFIGVFLQANTWSRIFFTIPAVFGNLFPEYKACCGTPVRLAMSMYGMTLSGKY